MINIINNPLNNHDVTNRMSYNVGIVFSILLNAHNDSSEDVLTHCLEYLGRAFNADEKLVLPANIIHEVYRLAAGLENSLIARALVCTASADWPAVYACVQAYKDELYPPKPAPEPEPVPEYIEPQPLVEDGIEDAEIIN